MCTSALRGKHAVLLRWDLWPGSPCLLFPVKAGLELGALSLEWPGAHCPHPDSEPGILARVISRVGLAPCPCHCSPSWQPGSQACPRLSAPVFAQDGYGPPPPPQKTRKHVLAVAGWSGVASLAPGPPPSKAASGQQPVVIGGIAGSPAARFLQLSKHGWLGRKPPVCGALAEPPVTTREQWPGWADGWVAGQPSLFPAPISKRDRLMEGLLPARLSHPSCFPPCRAYCLPSRGQGKQQPQEMSLACCWGSAALGGSRLGEGTRKGLALLSLHYAWDCS